MKRSFGIFLLMGMALCMSSCSSDNEQNGEDDNTTAKLRTLELSVEAPKSRVILEYKSGKLNAVWQVGDAISLMNLTRGAGFITTATAKYQARSTAFYGTIRADQGDQLAAIYPAINGTSITKTADNTTLHINLEGQKGILFKAADDPDQTNAGETISKKYNIAWGKGNVTAATETTAKATLVAQGNDGKLLNKVTVIKFKFYLPDGEKYKQAANVTKVRIGNVYTQADIDMNTGNLSNQTLGTIECSGSNIAPNGEFTVALLVGTNNLTGKIAPTFTVVGGLNTASSSTYTATFPEGTVGVNQNYQIPVKLKKVN